MTQNLELILSVKKSKFRIDDPTSEHSDSEYLSLKPQVLERDQFTCQCCGFKAKKWQEIHHRDNDHTNNSLDNLVTVCTLCHIVFHIGFAGYKQLGRLIYIDPAANISQADLNNIVRSLWIYQAHEKSGMDSLASSLLERIKHYSIVAHMMLSSSDPSILAEYMMTQMTDEQYEKRGELLSGFLMFPNKEAFPKQIAYWAKHEFSSGQSWKSMAMSNMKKWAENDFGSSDTGAVMRLLESE